MNATDVATLQQDIADLSKKVVFTKEERRDLLIKHRELLKQNVAAFIRRSVFAESPFSALIPEEEAKLQEKADNLAQDYLTGSRANRRRFQALYKKTVGKQTKLDQRKHIQLRLGWIVGYTAMPDGRTAVAVGRPVALSRYARHGGAFGKGNQVTNRGGAAASSPAS